jgi:hypothetical protein
MSKPPRAKYRTTNWTEYDAALKRRGSLMMWLDADLQWQAPSISDSGGPAVFSDAAIQFCLTLCCSARAATNDNSRLPDFQGRSPG